MIDQHARRTLREPERHELTVDLDPVSRTDLLTERGRQAVDRDAACKHPLLDFTARTHAGLCQHLLQALGLGERARGIASATLALCSACTRAALTAVGLTQRRFVGVGPTRGVTILTHTRLPTPWRARPARVSIEMGIRILGLRIISVHILAPGARRAAESIGIVDRIRLLLGGPQRAVRFARHQRGP